MEELINFINKFQKLDMATEEAIRSLFVKEIYRKDEFITEEGKICSKISFIQSGLVRRFYLADGNEVTKWLYHDGHWVSIMASYFNQKPSSEFLQACEPSTVYSLSYNDEQKLLDYPLFFKFYAHFFRCSLAAFDEFHFVFGSMTASNKYQYLQNKFPLLIKKAKQKHIAALLNISQETLSRIRAEII